MAFGLWVKVLRKYASLHGPGLLWSTVSGRTVLPRQTWPFQVFMVGGACRGVVGAGAGVVLEGVHAHFAVPGDPEHEGGHGDLAAGEAVEVLAARLEGDGPRAGGLPEDHAALARREDVLGVQGEVAVVEFAVEVFDGLAADGRAGPEDITDCP